MAVTVKTEKQIELMRESCRLLGIMHKELRDVVKPGISTWEINRIGEEIIRGFGCIPNYTAYLQRNVSLKTEISSVSTAV